MKRFSRMFQALFRFILIFFVAFIWIRYFVSSLWLSIVISICVATLTDFIFRIIFRKKNSVNSLKKAEQEEAENAFLSLSLNSNAADFFLRLAKSKHTAEKKNDCVLISHEDGEKVLLVPHLSHKNLTNDDIAKYALNGRKHKAKKIVICCGNADKECFSFIKNFDEEFVILNQYETYQKLYKAYNMLPEINMKYKKEKALAFKELAIFSLNKSRAKGYFISAVVLCISTFFVRATIYYCIVASVLTLLAIISLFNPFERNKKVKELL